MISRLENGDYVKGENGALETVELAEELLQNAFITLKAKRGRFYPNKNFGSRIYEINGEPFSEYALSYARQALDETDGVFALKCEIKDGCAVFVLLINNEEREVRIQLENNL